MQVPVADDWICKRCAISHSKLEAFASRAALHFQSESLGSDAHPTAKVASDHSSHQRQPKMDCKDFRAELNGDS